MTMRRRQLFLNLLAVVSTAFCVHAQNINNFNSNWVFGDSIHLRFSPTPSPLTPILNTAVTHNMRNSEGNASISDGFGNLLFYAGCPDVSATGYFNLYDANYNLMPNGQDLISHESASQGIIITRDPEDCSEYYVFYVSNTVGNGLRYSKVDMDLNGGMGDVIPGEKDILLYSTRGEKVIIAQKEDSKYFWVITRRINPAAGPLDELVAIGLQPGGTFSAPVVSVFSVPSASPGTGYMNMRSDNLMLADVQYATKQVNTYDFNPATGVFSNRTTIYNSPDNMPYGGCFSPGGAVFYVTFQQTVPGPGFGDEILRRYDLLNSPAGAIFTDVSVGLSDGFHAIQRSSKGKLYMTQGSTQFMHVVNDPDNYSIPNIVLNGLTATRMLAGGVPNKYFPWEAYDNLEFMNINGSQDICFNTSTVIGGTADSIQAIYSWQGQILTPSGWTTPSSSYLVNPNATNPTTINLTSSTRFILTITTECGDTIYINKEWVYLDSLSTPVVSGDLDYCFGETITPLTSTPALMGDIYWYSDAGLTSLLTTGTTFTPSNSVGSTTYYVVELLSGGLVPGPCTGFVTAVTVNIDPQAPLCYTKRAAKWYMGNTVALNFLCSSPPTPLDDCTSSYSGNMENNVSISDDNGNLLFYAYDNVVKNRNHVVMPNGSGLNTDYSASQGFLPVPHPTNPNRYYLFTIGSNGGTGFYYSEIDLLANGGLGDVVPATKNTMLLAGVPEHLTAVESCVTGETWVIVHDANNIYSFKLNAAGISAPVISSSPVSLPSSPGQIKASPTGRHIALSVQNSTSFLFTFDNETGEACYKETLTHGGYGCSFSNNGQYFYANEMFQGIYQYNVYAANVNPTAVLIYDPWAGGTFLYGGMHLGPDCKLYVFGQGRDMGTVINNPNSPGLACNIQVASFPLSNGTPDYNGHFSSANYVQSWFKDPTYVEPTIDADFTFAGTCASLPVSFTNTSTVITECPRFTWNFGDPASGANNTSTLENPTHLFTSPGTYTVSLTVEERCQSNTQTYLVTVSVPNVAITGDTVVCITDNVVLTASGGTSYTWTGPSWQPGGASSSTATVTNQGDPMGGGDNEGWYYVTVTDNGCSTTDSIYVTILQSPDVTITQTAGVCGTTLNAVINYSNGPISTYTWTTGGAPPVLGTGSSVVVAPTVVTEYVVFVVDSAGCGAGGLSWVGPVAQPAAPIIFTPSGSYCLGDNVATINTSTGDLWFTDAGLTTQVYNGQNYTPAQLLGTTTYYVIDTTGGCNSQTAQVQVTFTNCAGDPCATNLLTNGSFETYSFCPTGAQQIANATGWSGQGSYYNTVCNGYYNSASYYPYFNASNYNLGLNGGGTFPPPDGAGYASIFMGGGTGFFQHESISQQVNLYCSKQYTLQFRAMTPRSDYPPDVTLCVYGANGTPPFTGCAPSMTLLACLPAAGSVNNSWQQYTMTFTPTADYSYIVISGQCPSGTSNGTIMLDDIFLCGTCVNPPSSLSASQVSPETCLGNDGEGTISATSCTAPLTYSWALSSNPGVPVSGIQSPIDLVAGNYIVTATDPANCSSTTPVVINSTSSVPAPVVPVTTAPSCTAPTATVTVSSPVGMNYQYSINGGMSWQSSPVFSGIPASSSVTVTAQDISSSCVSTGTVVNIPVAPGSPAIPTIATTPATCLDAGTATVTNFVGIQTYTFNPAGPIVGGGGVITGMAAGTSYTVTAGNGSCTSAASNSFSIASQLTAPAIPAVATTTATCSASGTATVSNYTAGQIYTFTPAGPIVGGGGVITGMTPGTSYTVTAGNGACTSAASASFSIAAQLTTPAITTVATTPATCSAAGTATVSNYIGGQTYSFTPAGPTVGGGGLITGMTTGTSYTVTAGNGSCASTASASFSISAQLAVPTAPTASVTTSPTCAMPTGTVTVSTPVGANYQYSINGGTTWQTSPVFAGLTASGSVTIAVQDISSGCVSLGTIVNIPAIAGTPSAPVGTTQDPTCVLSGSITVSAPVGANYVYSIDGGLTWQSSTSFAGLTAQSYSIIVQDVSSGCESFATVFTLSAPVGPTVTVSSDVIFSEGESITLTASGADDYNWTPGTYLDVTTGSTVIATPDQSMVYCVVGTDTNGCTDTACVVLTMEIECGNLFVPNVFSPNENSKDDELCIFGAECVNDLVFRIYNRWGELVFETADPVICWDGKFRGEYVSSGAYAYTFEGTNVSGESVKREGTITVLR